jgi:hypothetical protein
LAQSSAFQPVIDKESASVMPAASELTPIFVTGIGRSGTSALLKSLLSHRQVLRPKVLGEAPFIGHFTAFLEAYENDPGNGSYHTKNYKISEPERLAAFRRLIEQLHVVPEDPRQRGDETVRYWPVKAFTRQEHFAKFKQLYPSPKILYIIRNGLEVVNSTRRYHGFKHLSFKAICKRWAGSITTNAFLEAEPSCAVILHHELIAEPAATMRKAFARIGIDHDDGPGEFLASNVFNSSFSETNDDEQVKDLFASRAAAWESWTEAEQATFIRICGAKMQERGFALPARREIVRKVAAKSPAVEPPKLVAPPRLAKVPGDTARKAPGDTTTAVARLTRFMTPREINYCTHLSFANKLLYAETPKVACSQIKYALQKAEHLRAGRPAPAFDRKTVHVRASSPLPQIIRLGEAEAEAALFGPDIFRFCFVRNPYTRALSAYRSKIERNLRPKTFILASISGTSPDEITDLTTFVTFREFLEVVAATPSIDMDIHWRPQVDQLFIGEIKYDLIGRFETLATDFEVVRQRLFADLPVGLESPHNRTGASEQVGKYFDRDCERLVREIYKRDFEVFDYNSESLPAAA